MNEINVMSKELAELIAAGEVIERPASVIKELLENSIDAGSTCITVEIMQGGINYIRITDNGKGISFEDMPLAFLRHATSKLSSKEMLSSIMTLGFRGEALASICAVSKVEVLSKRIENQYGVHYCIEGSVEKCYENSGCPDGTTIIVRDLFYNVPARLKFLKKAVTEGNAVTAVVNRIALSHPEISFKFIRDNKVELLTAGDGKLYSAVYTVFGREFANSLMEVDYTYNDIHVSGYTVKPLLGKTNRTYQNFFINNRLIKSVTCSVALDEAYRNSIMTGKFPACVLNIELSPGIVDVNVHPAKLEVRFSNEKLVFDSIYFAVKNSLLKNDKPTELKIEERQDKPNFTKSQLQVKEEISDLSHNQLKMNINIDSKKDNIIEKHINIENCDRNINKAEVEENTDILDVKKPANTMDLLKINEVTPKVDKNDEETYDDFKYISKESFVKKETPVKEEVKQEIIKPKVIGELFSTYIVTQSGDDVLLFDKHASHERYLFEKLKKSDIKYETQMLIEPVTMVLSYEEYDGLFSNKDKITSLGFNFEFKNNPEISVTGIPTIIEQEDIYSMVSELAHNCVLNMSNPSLDIVDDLLHSMACKAAIKGNIKSTVAELQKLVDEIYDDENIKYCPHGRPVMIKLSKKDIEKQFKRIV